MSRRRFLSILIAMVCCCALFIAYHLKTRLTIEEVKANSWVPGTCRIASCQGDVSFDFAECRLKDDGYIYHHEQPVAQFLHAYMPFFKASAPRTGGSLKLLNLQTREVCSYDSTS